MIQVDFLLYQTILFRIIFICKHIGNPTTYLGSTLSWNARQLDSYDDGTNDISYTYDSDGLRASKTINDAKFFDFR